MAKTLEYTHLPLNEDVSSIAGHYTPIREVRLKYDDREVLYVVGEAVIDSSCCGIGSWSYVLVPGYVVSWQDKRNEAGFLVSEVEPVSGKAVREDLSRVINETEVVSQIEFW